VHDIRRIPWGFPSSKTASLVLPYSYTTYGTDLDDLLLAAPLLDPYVTTPTETERPVASDSSDVLAKAMEREREKLADAAGVLMRNSLKLHQSCNWEWAQGG